MPIKKFTTWANRSKNTTYQANQDLIAVFAEDSFDQSFRFKTDGSSPPTTERNLIDTSYSTRDGSACPVKKGDYYRLDQTIGSSDPMVFMVLPYTF